MAIWTVSTAHKKSCEEHEHWTHPVHGTITNIIGWRSATFIVETTDDQLPKFVFAAVPGGNSALDSVNMYDCAQNNITSVDPDGDRYGWYSDVVWNTTMSEDDTEKIQDIIDEDGFYALEEHDWIYESDMWVWGSLEIRNERGELIATVAADANGNMITV